MERNKPAVTVPGKRTEIGRQAEERAAEFLMSRGYRVLARNYRWKRGEADLLCVAPDGAVSLIEVRSSARPSPWLKQSVNASKVRHLKQTLAVYLTRYPKFARQPRRIELIWVVGENIEHWPQPL